MPCIEDDKNLQIPLKDISVATNGFADVNFITKGGFGDVYKGVSEKYGCIAVKRLDPRQGQGDRQFKTEIALLSRCKHENIVSLVGFCDEDDEKIIVYKYESNGSLDKYVESKDLTWIQRLHICLDVARGLKYLHDDVGTHHRILHRDIKCSNILLDENWKAKISDFGLSRESPANVPSTFVISNPCGTNGYVDPEYRDNGYLTQKADVYSFGVVLCEVLCGRLTYVKYKDEPLSPNKAVQKHYNSQTLHRIIPSELYKQMNKDSLATFSNIAYQCLKNGEERPKMKQVVKQLQEALDYQRLSCHQEVKSPDGNITVKEDERNMLMDVKGVEKESRRRVELLSKVLESPVEGEEGDEKDEKSKGRKEEEGGEEEEEKEEQEEPAAEDDKKEKESKELQQEMVLKVLMDCVGCVKKVRRCLKGFQGVKDVVIDRENHKVVVKGNNVDSLKVIERVKKTLKRNVELLSSVSKSSVEDHKKPEQEEPPKQEEEEEEKHEQSPSMITVVLKVENMCCEGCAQRVKECILKMKGVESAVPDLNTSQVVVKGTLPAPELVDHVHKKICKRAIILEQEPDFRDKGSQEH